MKQGKLQLKQSNYSI
ncbi:hypothetical protein U9M48_040128 [Paspalum notatum var. saurae]|uniref:Uncharacterized protein n=1 Tax=Paspalum notatum var. saurae TaxID=547442 RepID=A0AAQ3UPW1_PASNO